MQSSRRLKTYLVRPESLLLCLQAARTGDSQWDFAEGDIPRGARLVRISWDPGGNVLRLLVEHESFALVPPGEPFPLAILRAREATVTLHGDPDDLGYSIDVTPDGNDLWLADRDSMPGGIPEWSASGCGAPEPAEVAAIAEGIRARGSGDADTIRGHAKGRAYAIRANADERADRLLKQGDAVPGGQRDAELIRRGGAARAEEYLEAELSRAEGVRERASVLADRVLACST